MDAFSHDLKLPESQTVLGPLLYLKKTVDAQTGCDCPLLLCPNNVVYTAKSLCTLCDSMSKHLIWVGGILS